MTANEASFGEIHRRVSENSYPYGSNETPNAIARLGRFCSGDLEATSDLAIIAQRYSDALEALGSTDHITLLPNRSRFSRDTERGRGFPGKALVLVSLTEANQFNAILRALGQGFGEEFVRAGAAELSRFLGPEAVLYHVSVLSFAFLTEGGQATETIARELAAVFAQPLVCEGLHISTRVGIGFVEFGHDPPAPSVMLRTALAAAQDSRSRAAGWARYDRVSDEAHQRSFHLVRDLGAALVAQDQLSIRFQPRIDMRDGHCHCAEVLLRWQHPLLGAISPAEFIPLAEATSLIEPLTEWVLGASLRQSAAWEFQSRPLALSVNVSAINLRAKSFVSHITDLLEYHGVPADRLELEVTEHAITGDDEATAASLAGIRQIGVGLAIDDFGTGYSNISNLAKVPAQVLKIDRSFLQPPGLPDRHRELVRSIIGMAHNLDYRVVAEGIEDQATYDLLASWDCEEGQGFHISRPLEAKTFDDWRSART
ncbi:hypothetical protein GCM10007036_10420 [Alsobacter metallidurans]|uniref:EAL domain-containing protein n=1 Tax=Alsobacter metallidurans TaxID=340221 RepID=A0A917MIP4_9HYPH|nr:GGDEF domain-containing phosphodiesterase [Alsobacter metallidurans]GGH12525.1 hypothetical protein GCM10007036_10420 [Alsobacter metallidurans]